MARVAPGSKNWASLLNADLSGIEALAASAKALAQAASTTVAESIAGVEMAALSGAAVVEALAPLNEWTVTGPTTVSLPAGAAPGGRWTVHVLAGFQDLSWPEGTVIYGSTPSDEAWVTLVREAGGWSVLVPDVTPPGERDTGWVYVVRGNYTTPITWTAGGPTTLAYGGPVEGIGDDATEFYMRMRRIGTRVFFESSLLGLSAVGLTVDLSLIPGMRPGWDCWASATRLVDQAVDVIDMGTFTPVEGTLTPTGTSMSTLQLDAPGQDASVLVTFGTQAEWSTFDPWPVGY